MEYREKRSIRPLRALTIGLNSSRPPVFVFFYCVIFPWLYGNVNNEVENCPEVSLMKYKLSYFGVRTGE